MPASVPEAPTAVAATAGDATATVTWTDPTSDGGAAITGYTVTAYDAGSLVTTKSAAAGDTSASNSSAWVRASGARLSIRLSAAGAALRSRARSLAPRSRPLAGVRWVKPRRPF